MANNSKSHRNLGTSNAIVLNGDVYDSIEQAQRDGLIHDGR